MKNIEKSCYSVLPKPKVTGTFLVLFYYQFESPHGSAEMTWYSALLIISRNLWTTLVKLKRWHICFKISVWEICALLLPLMDRKWFITAFVRRRSKLFILCPVYHYQAVNYWSQIMNVESCKWNTERIGNTEPDSIACQQHPPQWDHSIPYNLFTFFKICFLYLLEWWLSYIWQGYI